MHAQRYQLVFPDRLADDEDVVVVSRTDRSGPGGHPVYSDETGIVQAEISDQDEVRMLPTGGQQQPVQGVQAHPLPD
ncbi:hypothetical protein AMK16_20925 [Streptomyces sp. CB00455]|uniref:DUF6296 family protein n=1 Tax=Streptomyces sp. CB00455 TaxID=1703927 RepID=UPI00093F65E4|nr:DUF6296 family protein [Streptomyces sp. CB00455]OKK17325.1 hypothetical protein AMK16_20925 [Streptomyces sp. CB00455]